MEEIQGLVRQLERRGGWLGWAVAIVLALVALAALSLSVRAVRAEADEVFGSPLRVALLVLLCLALVACAYAFYLQRSMQRIRGQLRGQIAARIRLQSEVINLQTRSILDPLTSLYNRPFLEQYLGAETARSQRHGHSLTALMLTLHDVTELTNRYGESARDCVRKEFADRLRSSLRSSDLAVYMGGDEFLVLFPESSLERVPHILTRLSSLEADYDGRKIPVNFAAGWTAYRHSETPEEFLRRLEREVIEDQKTGKSQEAIRQAQTEIRQNQSVEALGRLAGKVAHDYNNLLNLVKGYSELMLDSLGQSDPLREYVEQIHEANERANSLTRQLLAFTKKQAAGPGELDVNALLVGLEPTLRRLLGDTVEVVSKPGPMVGRVKSDRGQVEQILLNLALYTRETMPQGGKFTIETANAELDEAYTHWHPGARPGPYVMLSARDNGAGIDEEALTHIFDPLFPAKKKGRGTALSLAAVYGIVKQSGGYIWVESEHDRGTTFSIFLPRVSEAVAAAPA